MTVKDTVGKAWRGTRIGASAIGRGISRVFAHREPIGSMNMADLHPTEEEAHFLQLQAEIEESKLRIAQAQDMRRQHAEEQKREDWRRIRSFLGFDLTPIRSPRKRIRSPLTRDRKGRFLPER